MKKQLLIFSTLAFAAGLTAFGFITDGDFNHPTSQSFCKPIEIEENTDGNTSCQATFASTFSITEIVEPATLTDFYYDFGSRFSPISKEDLSKAREVSDFIDENEIKNYGGVLSTTLIVMENDVRTDKRVSGKGEKLSKEQLKMIRSMDYSSNFLLRAVFRTENAQAESNGENLFYPHRTIVPESQAMYEGGKDGLLDYLRKQNEKNIYDLDEKKLQPAKLSFTVTKHGTVEDAALDRTSGYSKIDEAMISLINNLPGKWEPAQNANGEKVDQILVVSFGMVGC
jgi:hypothetical protein